MSFANGVRVGSQSPSAFDRREFLRLDYRGPIKFLPVNEVKDTPFLGTIENISECGILFQSNILPQISSLLWMSLDITTLEICRDIERRVLIFNDGIVGRVVRIEENPLNSTYRIGICFLTQTDADDFTIQR